MYRVRGVADLEPGPYALEQLRTWLAEGRLTAATEVCREGDFTWVRLGSLLLVSEIPPAPPSLPPPPITPPPLPRSGPRKRTKIPNSGFAVASFLLGLLGFLGVPAIVGLIFSVVAMVRIRRSQGQVRGKLYAVVGGLVSILFLGLWIAFIIAFSNGMGRPMHRPMVVQDCRMNLASLGRSFRAYANDNADLLPAAANWSDSVREYVSSLSVFVCPGASSGHRSSFAMNSKLSGLNMDQVSPKTVLLFESGADWNGAGGPELARSHLGPGQTLWILHVDGSQEMVLESAVSNLRWDP